MRRLIRAILFVVVVLIVLAIVGLVGVILFANRAVQTAVETAGTRALNVAVRIDRTAVSLSAGTVELYGIIVANPPGYEGPALLKLQQTDFKVNTGSLLSKQVHIEDMKLDNMEVFIEQKGLQNNLYQVIQPLRQPRRPTGRGLLIDNLEIRNVTVHAAMTTIPGQTPGVDLKIASIRMTDLGRHEKVDTAVLISKIVLAVAEGIAQQGGGILPKETIGELGSILDKALDLGKIILGPSGKTPEGQEKENLGQTVTDGLKDLLGGQKNQ
jgi:hypothetical protein